MNSIDYLQKAIRSAGGVSALAKALRLRQSTVSNWPARGRVPAEYCPSIERITGVRCERLRPDVEWSVLRKRGVRA